MNYNKKILLNALQKCLPYTTNRSLQILNCVKFHNGKVSATNLDEQISITIGEDSGSFCVNAKNLYEIVKNVNDEVVLMLADNQLVISSGKFIATLSTLPIDDFPIKEIPSRENYIDMKDVAQLVGRVAFAASQDESRAQLKGCHFVSSGENITLCATDGHRMAICTVPQQAIKATATFNAATLAIDPDMKLVIEGNQAMFFNDTTTIIVKLIEGQYPDITRVIPTANNKFAKIKKDELIAAVKRISVLSNEKTNLIKLLFDNNILDISVANRNIGAEAKDSIIVEYQGEQLKIGLNSLYFLELLSKIPDEEITMEMNTSISGVVFRGESYMYLLMPLRIIESE